MDLPSPPTNRTADRPAFPGRDARLRWSVRVVVALACAAVVALLVYGLIARSPDTAIDDSLARGRAPVAPGFTLAVLDRGALGQRLDAALRPTLADGSVSLRELRGHRIVVNFWASWCAPCRQEAPLLQRSWMTARRDGVLFIGLDMQDLSPDARGFLTRYGTDYLTIRDPGNTAARSYGVTGVPETFFVSARGRVVNHVIGVATPDDLRAGIAATATGRPVRARRDGPQGRTR